MDKLFYFFFSLFKSQTISIVRFDTCSPMTKRSCRGVQEGKVVCEKTVGRSEFCRARRPHGSSDFLAQRELGRASCKRGGVPARVRGLCASPPGHRHPMRLRLAISLRARIFGTLRRPPQVSQIRGSSTGKPRYSLYRPLLYLRSALRPN